VRAGHQTLRIDRQPVAAAFGMNTSNALGSTSRWIFDGGPFGPMLLKSISEKKKSTRLLAPYGTFDEHEAILINSGRAAASTAGSVLAP
jgi:hypothetical protein